MYLNKSPTCLGRRYFSYTRKYQRLNKKAEAAQEYNYRLVLSLGFKHVGVYIKNKTKQNKTE